MDLFVYNLTSWFKFILVVYVINLLWIINSNSNTKEHFFYNNPIDKINGVVYINLENREDRKKLIKEEMNKMGIPKDKIHKVSGVFIPKNGHKGCVQSHILALQMAKMNNWNNTLILEDDVDLTGSPEEFKSKLNDMFNYLNNKEWDVIMIAKSHHINEDLEDTNIIKKIKSSTGGLGYIIKKHYYNKLLDLFIDCNNHMTTDKWGNNNDFEPYALDQKWSELQGKDNWYGFKTDLLKQRNIWSTINDKGNKVEGFDNYGKKQDIELSPVLSDEDKINLKKGQEIMTNMLYEFDRICRQYNLKYWCIGGTLIGAMRHNSWVPWDGDVDIGMLKEDYNKFKNIVYKELPKNMEFSEPNGKPCSKLRSTKANYIYTKWGNNWDENKGIQIDIFIFDLENGKIKGGSAVCGTPDKITRNKEDLFPLKTLPFDNIKVYVPNKYQKISEELWNSYPPVLPPIEKRYPHEGKIKMLN